MISTGNTAGRIRIAMRIPEIPAADGTTGRIITAIITIITIITRNAARTKENSL